MPRARSRAAVEEHVPADAAVAADFMSSTAVLAHTGRAIVLQPKWETATSRERVQRFWEAFYRGTPDQLAALVRENSKWCRLIWKRAEREGSELGCVCLEGS